MNDTINVTNIDTALDTLLLQVNEVLSDIEGVHAHTAETLEHVDARVNDAAHHIDTILIELTATETACEDSLDELILKESEAIARDEEE